MASNREWLQKLSESIKKRIDAGENASDVLESLSVRQYDALIDAGYDFDRYVLPKDAAANISQIKRDMVGRKRGSYQKKYGEDRQEVYNGIVRYLTSCGYQVTLPEKVNFRDLTFIANGKKYNIIMSMPRK